MKNTMFADNINEKVEALKELVKELVECVAPDIERTERASDLEKVHSLYFLKALDTLRDGEIIVNSLIDIPEDEFEKLVTEDGKHTLEEVKLRQMMSMMMKMTEAMNHNEAEG